MERAYKWMVKQWPDTAEAVYNPAADFCRVTVKKYEKGGAAWRLVETWIDGEKETGEYYSNVVSAIPFFRSLGGVERVTKAYTRRGFLPVKIESISPDGTEKTVRAFEIL